ncbi:MAG: hypothetical protein V5A48_14475 [Salinivenus sp.]
MCPPDTWSRTFALLPDPDFSFPRSLVETTDSSCTFVRDSGRERALV